MTYDEWCNSPLGENMREPTRKDWWLNEIVQIIPAPPGFRVAWVTKNENGFEASGHLPLMCLGLRRDGLVVPIEPDGDHVSNAYVCTGGKLWVPGVGSDPCPACASEKKSRNKNSKK